MKMNNFLILLLILFIVLLFLVYYYKYLRKQQFESFSQLTTEERTKELTLILVGDKYITSDLLDCDAKYAKVVSRSTDKGKVTFPTVNDSANTCETSTKFTYSINSADLIKLQNDNVENITIRIKYKVATKIIIKIYNILLPTEDDKKKK